jgi:hypothetical protein
MSERLVDFCVNERSCWFKSCCIGCCVDVRKRDPCQCDILCCHHNRTNGTLVAVDIIEESSCKFERICPVVDATTPEVWKEHWCVCVWSILIELHVLELSLDCIHY